MDWIKRNLYFLIGSLLALALMGLAGGYLYSKWQLNNEILGQLDEAYATLKRLYEQRPHPGSGQVDNIKLAKEQEQELRAYIQKARQFFQSCPPIPAVEAGALTSQEFSFALSRTIDRLERDAKESSVTLPPRDSKGNPYSFSFAAQRESLAYAPGSLGPLSVQLGEVKSICGILFQAKINSLDSLRRERVSDDDLRGPQTDYLAERSVTNELAVMSPYEVTFRCFSSELASVLAGFGSAPCALLIKSINVESAPAGPPVPEQYAPPTMPATPVAQPYVAPRRYAPPPPPVAAERPVDDFAARYGLGAARGAPAAPAPAAPTRYRYRYPRRTTTTAQASSRGGLPVALDEQQLKVTLMVYAVKLLPAP